MSELTNLDDAKTTLRRLILAALDANRALSEGLQNPKTDPPNDRRARFNSILDSLHQTREGFALALRAENISTAVEMRALIAAVVNDWSWLTEIGLRWQTDAPIEKLGGQVILYQHALIAMRVLPTLPPAAITFPKGRYTDITAPSTPGETLSRFQELEQTIWGAIHEPIGALPPTSVRRTYAFFDATTWLIATYLSDIIGWSPKTDNLPAC
jgi:hypothetical protein